MDFTVQATLFICNARLLWTHNRIDAVEWFNPGQNPITETSAFLADTFLSCTRLNNKGSVRCITPLPFISFMQTTMCNHIARK